MTVPSARTLGLAGVGVVLLVVLMMVLSDDGGGTDAAPQPRFDERATAPGDVPVVDVKLEALQRERLEIGAAQRNLFRFQLPPAESSSPSPFLPPGPPLGLPSARDIPVAGPVGPPPPPPIPIKFIGLAGAPGPEGAWRTGESYELDRDRRRGWRAPKGKSSSSAMGAGTFFSGRKAISSRGATEC